MDEPRSKRAIRTPRRFDDEAFETPQKSQQPKVVTGPVESSKPPPEPVQPKSIIKVKLTKVQPRQPIKLKLDPPTPKEPVKFKDTPKPKDSTKPKETPIKPKEPVKQQKEIITPTAVKHKETPNKIKETPIEPKDIVKSNKEQPTKLKELGKSNQPSRPKEPIKTKEPLKPREAKPSKELIKPKELVLPEPLPIVHRPRTKRPRTPPIYADLIPNVVLPFWDARTAADEHEDDNVKELVHCHCGVPEELGLMVQCETCLTWQHAHCLGVDKAEDVPDGYTCKACSDPRFARESMRRAYDQDWLTKGKMRKFPCDPEPIPESKIAQLRQINQLIASTLNIQQLIHSLRVKQRILMNSNDDDSELKLFKNPWPANYQHRDGSQFIPSTQTASTPASTISVMAETPDPGDIAAEAVADAAAAALPDIGHLDDVTAILDGSFVQNSTILTNDTEVTPNDCRANLKLHILQTEEFIQIELNHLEEQILKIESELKNDTNISLDSLKNDLLTMKDYVECLDRD